MTADPVQRPLPLAITRRDGPPFIEGAANAEAIARLASWKQGHEADAVRPLAFVAAIIGPVGYGKTMLLERMAEGYGVRVRRPDADFEAALDGAPAICVDDVDEAAPLDLFALIEAATARRVPLLLAGKGKRTDWAGPKGAALPDLESRLKSVTEARLDAPDEAMLARVLAVELEARGLRLPFLGVAEAASQLRRELAAATGFAALVETVASRGYKRSRVVLRDALAEADAFRL